VVDIAAGDERFRDDHGQPDPGVLAVLTAYAARSASEQAVLAALSASRLLVPVVALAADRAAGPGDSPAVPGSGQPRPVSLGAEKSTEMAMPVIVGRDGRRAIPAFTCAESLREWRPEARPVPVTAAGVWQSAVQESCSVIVDIAGPVPFAVEGARLSALAAGSSPPALHEDPDVWQLAAAVAAEFAPGIRVRLAEPPDGLDVALELAPPAGQPGPVAAQTASQIGDALTARLGARVRSGIAVVTRSAR
jgi:hypothetical protein